MSAAAYANYVFLNELRKAEFTQEFGIEWRFVDESRAIFDAAMQRAFLKYGYAVGDKFDDIVENNIKALIGQGVIQVEGDNYTGYHYKLNGTIKVPFINAMLKNDEIANRIDALGERAHERALNRLAEEFSWQRDEGSFTIENATPVLPVAPASNRIVSFSDNQVHELDGDTTQVINALAEKDQIEGSPGLRELILGQLRAGRELIRAGSVRIYLLELTLIESLKFLVKRYEKEAVGGLAASLIATLMKHLGLAS